MRTIKRGNFVLYVQNEDVISDIVADVPFSDSIGYAGFKSRMGLEQFLKRNFVSTNKIDNNVINIVFDALKKCQKIASCKVNIFMFPSSSEFAAKEMGGVSGFCTWKSTVVIMINKKFSKKSLQSGICHEYAHVVNNYHFNGDNTIGECLVYEGIAEHFKEHVVGDKSPWTSAISEDKSVKILRKLNVDSKSAKLFVDLFFSGKKYPHWAGYSIGYQIVKQYMKNTKKSIIEIMHDDPRKIMKESKMLM